MDLTEYSKEQLSKASRDAIAAAMAELPITHEQSPCWLQDGHKYGDPDISKVLRQDTQAKTLDGPALAQRMAASLPSHVLDGWSLLGRALHCLLKGDTRTAVHLGYYAELRAALAIAASEGIAVFDTQHFVIESDSTAHRLCSEEEVPTDSGTHSSIWPIYDWWLQQEQAFQLISQVVQPGGQSINEWFNVQADQELYVAQSAREWLTDWGLDLKRMFQDQGARNASSYGPSALHNWQTIDHTESLRVVIELWRFFDPTKSSRFEEIDRLLLRRIFHLVFSNKTTRKRGSQGWNREIGRFVESFLDGVEANQLVQSNRDEWREFLIGLDSDGSTSTLMYASKSSLANDLYFPVEMLSRAALLLRLASGSCGRHLIQANSHWESMMFWLDGIGARRGFWPAGQHPDLATDLWSNIENILDDFDTGVVDSESGWYELEECERIGMWGLGI